MMLEAARTPMFVAAVIAWLAAAVLIFAVVRWKLTPDVRRTMRRLAWGYSAGVILIMLSFIVGRHQGVILSGWFYASVFVGVLIPMQLALVVAGMDLEKPQQ
jgi:hypothetical protein